MAKIIYSFGREIARGQNSTIFWPRVAKIRRAWPKLMYFRGQSFGRHGDFGHRGQNTRGQNYSDAKTEFVAKIFWPGTHRAAATGMRGQN
jgi:hypothetical protein